VEHRDPSAGATQLGRTGLLLPGPAAAGAQRRLALLGRYHKAVYRYYLAALGDDRAARALHEAFVLQLVEARTLAPAEWPPGPLRFSLKELLRRHAHAAAPRPDPAARSDPLFEPAWRQEVLNQTWQSLALREGLTARPLYQVLLCRAEHRDWSEPQVAAWTGLSGAALRRTLHDARAAFAELLLEEVARTLDGRDEAGLAQELTELSLLPYCRRALRRRQAGGR
jgi:hypothetical protein